MDPITLTTIAKLVGIFVLMMFLPLTAYTYYAFRRERGRLEAKRILDLLNVDDTYRRMYGFGGAQYDLELMALDSPAALPKQGRNRVIVAKVADTFYARIFDRTGKQVTKTDKFLPDAELTQQLEAALHNQALDALRKSVLIHKITSSLGHPHPTHTCKDGQIHPPEYEQADNDHLFLLLAVIYVSMVSCVGLIILLMASDKGGLPEFNWGTLGDVTFPKPGSRLIFGMAFLGAYVWGLQYIFQRYSLNDLTPSVYYNLGVRMIFASLTALVLFNATEAFALGDGNDEALSKVWPAIAFLIGMFPRRGIRWFTERIPLLSSQNHPSLRKTSLEMIEGLGSYDSIRLEEQGIDTCYDLATADFVPLMLKTPYSARQIVDWILQAKMCACFGEGVKELRENGIRTIAELEHLTDQEIEKLTAETSLTKSALMQARASVKADIEVERLQNIGLILGKFSHVDDEDPLVQKIQRESQRADQAEQRLADLRAKLQKLGTNPDHL